MLKSFSKIILSIILLTQLTSCASIWNGTTQTVTFDTTPPGADTYINNQFVGQTPVAVKLKRKQSYYVLLAKDGFQNENFRLESSFDPKTALNLIPGICTGGACGFFALCSTMGYASTNQVALCAGAGLIFGMGVSCAADCIIGGAYKFPNDQINIPMKPTN